MEQPMNADEMPAFEDDSPFAKEGFALMAAVFAVHKELGGGLSEEIYQECLELELGLRGIPFEAHAPITAYYRGHELKKRYVPDLYVHDQIVVELKAVDKLLPEHWSQVINYMRLAQKPIGYLINLAPQAKVDWKRIILSQFLQR